ncbi:MAG: MXAN_2562 family outer membrane beta-barrel protein [Pseudomonadota bacterium]
MRPTICLGLLLFFCNSAEAQWITEKKDYSSPKNFAFELKLGPYSPNIDSEFITGKGPYETIFGESTGLMFQAEFDYQIWNGFGNIGLGLSAGFFNVSANACKDDGSDTTPSSCIDKTQGETSIMLFPFSLLAVYRFDVLATKWDIPFVPFGKIGPNYTLWWTQNTSENIKQNDSANIVGGTFGWQVNAGVSLLLDVFEPDSAKALDNDLGINHTYLFFEFAYVKADGFGSKTALHVGDITWQAGLAFEF